MTTFQQIGLLLTTIWFALVVIWFRRSAMILIKGIGLGRELVSKLVDFSKKHKKIILYSVPGKEAFYKKLGFKRMSTAMAIFENQDQALERGLVNDT